MGMIAAFYMLSDSNIDKILADPPLVWKVVAPDDIELADGDSMDTDVDKAWHGIHYLLTKTDWGGAFPLNFLVEEFTGKAAEKRLGMLATNG